MSERTRERVRLNLQLSEELSRALDEMADELDANKSEVIRRALTLMKLAHDRKKRGEHLGFAKNADQLDTEIVGAV